MIDAKTAAANAIDLFLEYRDVHGYDEAQAKLRALEEIDEGLQAGKDLSHLCSLCHSNFVDTDAGFDVCDDCRRRQ